MSSIAKVPLGAPLIYVYAAAAGALGALAALGFQSGTEALQEWFLGGGESMLEAARALPAWKKLLIPTVGAAVGALIVRFVVQRRTAFGVTDLMEVVSLRKRRIRSWPTIARCLSSAAVISTGGSVGREGPIIQLGATLADRVARLTRIGPRRQAILLGCGVSAGMAAAYNAPIAGAFFVMEVILANFAIDVFVPVMLSSLVSTLVIHELRGGAAIYTLPEDLQLIGVLPFFAALLLGIPCGALAVGFQKLLGGAGRAFRKLPILPEGRAAIGGLIVGVIGLSYPEVWGNGYNATSELLALHLPLATAGLLLLLKPIATAATVGSGGSGGVFTPTLFLGACAGTLFGHGLTAIGMDVPPAAFAVIGMAATIAGTTQAPIMSMTLLFEMTHNQGFLLPLMLGTLASAVTARLLAGDSIYTQSLRSRGVPVDAGIEELTLHRTRVRDIMISEVERVSVETSLDDILHRFQATRRDQIYVVGERKSLLGVVRLHDVKPFLNQDDLGPVVIAADVMQTPSAVDPDASLAEVIERFDDPELEELPVTRWRDGQPVLVGRVTRRDLIACMNLEVLKRQSLRAKFVSSDREPSYVELPKGYQLARFPVPTRLVGRTIGRSGMRKEDNLSIITLIETDPNGTEHRLVPDPELELKAGHSLVVMGEKEAVEAFRDKEE